MGVVGGSGVSRGGGSAFSPFSSAPGQLLCYTEDKKSGNRKLPMEWNIKEVVE